VDDLRDNEARVWRVSLDSASTAAVDQALRIRAEDERQRASGFVAQRVREQYILTRGILRQLLGEERGLHQGNWR